MSKYQPLWQFVKQNNRTKLTFEEIKNILGFELDHSFLTYKKQAKEYGFEIKKISLKEKFVIFSKI